MPVNTSTFTYQVEPYRRDRLTTLLVSIRKKAAPRKKYGKCMLLSPLGKNRSEEDPNVRAINMKIR